LLRSFKAEGIQSSILPQKCLQSVNSKLTKNA
jgi:hypothetical protein